jgi:hypothetical protein
MTTPPPRLDELIGFIKKQDPDAGPLQCIAAAVHVGEHLGEVADHLIGHFVDQARKSGASWTEIGANMGVSKQAVQKRFVARDADQSADIARIYGRYTNRARHVVVEAQRVAKEARSGRIDTEHLLAGLLCEPDGVGAKAIVRYGAPLDEVRRKVSARYPEPAENVPEAVPFSAGAKKALELALRAGLRLGHSFVGTEHILLGLLELGEGTGPEVLAEIGVEKDAAEAMIVEEFTKALKI